MRQETIIKTYLKFSELTEEQKDEAIELNFTQDACHFEHCLEERIDTLKQLAKYIYGTLNYSISCVPDRGEHITIKDYDKESLELLLMEYDAKHEGCILTGVCYDDDLLDAIKENNLDLDAALHDYLKSIHDEYESTLTHEYIADMCEANEYEFDADTLELA